MARIDERIMPRIARRINRSPKISKPDAPVRRRKDLHESFIAQARLMRLMELIMFLQASRYTVSELAVQLDQSERTIYRYLNILDTLGFGVEKDFAGRYFIVEHTCPLCGGELES